MTQDEAGEGAAIPLKRLLGVEGAEEDGAKGAVEGAGAAEYQAVAAEEQRTRSGRRKGEAQTMCAPYPSCHASRLLGSNEMHQDALSVRAYR